MHHAVYLFLFAPVLVCTLVDAIQDPVFPFFLRVFRKLIWAACK